MLPTVETGERHEDATSVRSPSGNELLATFNEQTNYVPKKKIITIFLTCSTVDLVALLDQTSLAAATLTIGTVLNAGAQTSWIAGAYFLTSTSFQLLYGRLSDIWSRKLVLLVCLLVFSLGSLAASLAQNAMQLIIFRAVTGIGGGGLMTIAQTIVGDVVPLRERGKYQGILGSVVAIAHGIGPVIGGILVSQSANSWRWIFRLNLPLSVFTGTCIVFFMPLRKVQGNWKMKLKAVDFLGAVLTLGGTAALVLGLTWGGGEYHWESTQVIVALTVAAIISVAFVGWQWKGTKLPLMPIQMFKARLVSGACLTTFINGWIFLVQVYYIPILYQLVFSYSATKAGAMLLPITLMQTLSSTFSGLVVHWIGRYRESILLGWLVWAVGMGLLSTLDASDGLGKQIGYSVLTGLGLGQTLQTSLIAVQAGVKRGEMSVVTSTRNFLRNLGGTLGLAISGTILNTTLRNALQPLSLPESTIRSILNNPSLSHSAISASESDALRIRQAIVPAYLRAFRTIFLVCAGLAALAFVLALLLIPQVDLDKDDEELKVKGLEREKQLQEMKEARRSGRAIADRDEEKAGG